MKEKIKYKGGYKYQLVEKYAVKVKVKPDKNIISLYINLNKKGILTIKKGYAWDGPSGPTVDTKTFMRGSLAHDALYQLMRNGFIESEKWRKQADRELKRICIEDGMNRIRAQWVYWGVRWGAKKAASTESQKEVIEAP